jgi:hypothetical protein
MAQPIKKPWLTPKGRKLCEPYQNLDGGQKARHQLSPLPKIGEGFREWLKPSLGKEGWVVVKKELFMI